jgi:hypothetical protein
LPANPVIFHPCGVNPSSITKRSVPAQAPQTVIEYLGRYTHKVAISNHRICSIGDEDDTVTFEYKDYADGTKQKQMTLGTAEFIRRFQQHILPVRFTKIRTYPGKQKPPPANK